jgi:hypothetical protein
MGSKCSQKDCDWDPDGPINDSVFWRHMETHNIYPEKQYDSNGNVKSRLSDVHPHHFGVTQTRGTT